MQKRIIIIGGAGYIGSVLANFLYKKSKDCEIIVVDKKIYIKQKYNFEKVRYISCEIKNIFKQITFYKNDIIIFLAGLVGDPITNKYKKVSSNINYKNIKSFFLKISKKKINRILFVSTCSNYGLNKNTLLTEESPLKPLSPYAVDKVRIEKLIMNIQSKIPMCIFRFATAFGYSKRMRLDLTVNDFCYQLTKNKKIIIYDADTWRPYCHVKDFARAIYKFITISKKKIDNQIYNIGSNKNNFKKRDIAKKIIKYLKRIKSSNYNVQYTGYSKDKRNYKVDFSKMEKRLKIRMKYNLDYGIREMITIYKKKSFEKKHPDRGNFKLKESFVRANK